MRHSIIGISLSIAALLSFSSCLDLDPISDIGESAFYKNESDLKQAVIACYNGLQAPTTKEWFLTELRSDNAKLYLSGSEATISKSIKSLDMFQLDTSHSEVEAYWKAVYHNIANCNAVLKYSNVVANDSIKKMMDAEAYFIRSYHYFNLVRLFGPVFLVTEQVSGDAAKLLDRKSIEEVYQLIEEDLHFAIQNLPNRHLKTDKGRVDKSAAKTLLAKVYLTNNPTQERLNLAKTLLLEVEDTSKSGYKLVTSSFADVFDISKEMNDELIFVVRYKAGNLGLGSSFANDFAPALSRAVVINGSGLGYNCPTEDLRAYFNAEPADLRKSTTLVDTWTNESNEVIHTAYVKKYLSPVVVKNDAENDFPVLRYADVLLMLAEIENELTGPSAGLVRLNAVRNRAGLRSLDAAEISNKILFRQILQKERRIEFAFENQRYFDLLRTNTLISTLKAHFELEQERKAETGATTSYYQDPKKSTYMKETTIQAWQTLLPIPFSVLSVMPNATQNPNY